MRIPAFANSVVPNRMASDQDLHCLPFSLWISKKTLYHEILLPDGCGWLGYSEGYGLIGLYKVFTDFIYACISTAFLSFCLIQILYFDFLRQLMCFSLTSSSLLLCDMDIISCLLVYYTWWRLKHCENKYISTFWSCSLNFFHHLLFLSCFDICF